MVEPEHKVKSESISKRRNAPFRNEIIQDILKELRVPSQKCPLGLVRAPEPLNETPLTCLCASCTVQCWHIFQLFETQEIQNCRWKVPLRKIRCWWNPTRLWLNSGSRWQVCDLGVALCPSIEIMVEKSPGLGSRSPGIALDKPLPSSIPVSRKHFERGCGL